MTRRGPRIAVPGLGAPRTLEALVNQAEFAERSPNPRDRVSRERALRLVGRGMRKARR